MECNRYYCVECGRKLLNFKTTNDWNTRKMHKVCWKRRNEYVEMCRRNEIEFDNRDKYDTLTGLRNTST